MVQIEKKDLRKKLDNYLRESDYDNDGSGVIKYTSLRHYLNIIIGVELDKYKNKIDEENDAIENNFIDKIEAFEDKSGLCYDLLGIINKFAVDMIKIKISENDNKIKIYEKKLNDICNEYIHDYYREVNEITRITINEFIMISMKLQK